MAEASNIQFDRTFDTVSIQFYQLWTIFVGVGRHTIPAIHCLMTAKTQYLYRAVLECLITHIPRVSFRRMRRASRRVILKGNFSRRAKIERCSHRRNTD